MQTELDNPLVTRLFIIEAPHFYVGIEIWNGYVAKAPPIVKYMENDGWTIKQVKKYCARKHWFGYYHPEEEGVNPHD